jgi:hypothetical protein
VYAKPFSVSKGVLLLKSMSTIATVVFALVVLLSFSVLATPKVSSSKQDKAAEQTVDKNSSSTGANDGRDRGDAGQSGTVYEHQSSGSSGTSYGSTTLESEPPIKSNDPEPIPEPGTLILMSAGLVAVGTGVRRRMKNRSRA